jgi:hypothetical protein
MGANGMDSVRITYESLSQFARENGDVKLNAAEKAQVIILKDGTPDLVDVIEHHNVLLQWQPIYASRV